MTKDQSKTKEWRLRWGVMNMGDRGNIVLRFTAQHGEDEGKDEGKTVDLYLYTHWKGSKLQDTLRAALERGRGRWDDDSYLARIIFCEMIKNDVLGDTGYGISPWITDNEHTIIVVDLAKQMVAGYPEGTNFDVDTSNKRTFAEFVVGHDLPLWE